MGTIGRILGYVFLDSGTFVNAEIIRQGFGFAYNPFLKVLDLLWGQLL